MSRRVMRMRGGTATRRWRGHLLLVLLMCHCIIHLTLKVGGPRLRVLDSSALRRACQRSARRQPVSASSSDRAVRLHRRVLANQRIACHAQPVSKTLVISNQTKNRDSQCRTVTAGASLASQTAARPHELIEPEFCYLGSSLSLVILSVERRRTRWNPGRMNSVRSTTARPPRLGKELVNIATKATGLLVA